MAGPTVNIKILADATQATKTLDQASSKTSKIGKGFKAAAVPIAAASLALVGMGKSAIEDAAGQAALAKQLQTSTNATQDQVAAVEHWISKTAAASGVADDQLRPAMAALARSTGSVTKSQEAMGLAMDIAAATGKPLQRVSEALAKGYAGNTAALGRLVPGLDKGTLATKDMAKITKELQKQTKGASAAAAQTAAGKFKRMTLALDEAQESIGGALLPVLSQLVPILLKVATFAQNNAAMITKLVVVLGVMAAAVWAVNAAMKIYQATQTVIAVATRAWAAAQWLLNAAMSANPIGLVIAIVLALVAAVVLAYKKCATFRAIVQAAWRGIAAAAQWAWKNILQPILLAIVAQVKRVWSAFLTAARIVGAAARAIAAAAMWMWRNVIRPVINFLISAFNRWWQAVVTVKDKIVSAFRTVWETAARLKDKAISAFEALARAAAAPFEKIAGIVSDAIGWVQKLIDKITNFKVPKWLSSIMGKVGNAIGLTAAPVYLPAPTLRAGSAAPRTRVGSTATAASGAAMTMARLTSGENAQVVVQVSDRRMADLIDVQLRQANQARARSLTRRQVVIV